MIDLDEIERLVEGATPGKWYYTTCYGVANIEAGRNNTIAHAVEYLKTSDAQYIAAMNPETTKHLINRIRKLEAIREVANCLSDPYTGAGCSDRKKCRVCSALTEYNEWRKEKPSD